MQELGAKLDGFLRLMDERDRRYEERHVAVEKAMLTAHAAADKAVGAALEAVNLRRDRQQFSMTTALALGALLASLSTLAVVLLRTL